MHEQFLPELQFQGEKDKSVEAWISNQNGNAHNGLENELNFNSAYSIGTNGTEVVWLKSNGPKQDDSMTIQNHFGHR